MSPSSSSIQSCSLICYATQEKKQKNTKEKEGDGSCHHLLHEAALQRSFRREKRRRRQCCYRHLLHYAIVLQRSSTTESPSSAALQHNSIAGRRRRQLPSLSLWSYATTQLRSKEKKVTAVAVAFFVGLRRNAAPQQTEEGDGNYRRLLHGAALQRNSIVGRRR